jgi:hypothetical protein
MAEIKAMATWARKGNWAFCADALRPAVIAHKRNPFLQLWKRTLKNKNQCCKVLALEKVRIMVYSGTQSMLDSSSCLVYWMDILWIEQTLYKVPWS